jgi:hypothetical protein
MIIPRTSVIEHPVDEHMLYSDEAAVSAEPPFGGFFSNSGKHHEQGYPHHWRL